MTLNSEGLAFFLQPCLKDSFGDFFVTFLCQDKKVNGGLHPLVNQTLK